MVGNYVDDKGDVEDPETGLIDYDRVAWISSQPIFVPSAAEVTLSLEGVPLKGYTTSNGFTADFQPITSIKVNSSVAENPNGKSSYWLYTIHVNNRDDLMQKLKEDGIIKKMDKNRFTLLIQ